MHNHGAGLAIYLFINLIHSFVGSFVHARICSVLVLSPPPVLSLVCYLIVCTCSVLLHACLFVHCCVLGNVETSYYALSLSLGLSSSFISPYITTVILPFFFACVLVLNMANSPNDQKTGHSQTFTMTIDIITLNS